MRDEDYLKLAIETGAKGSRPYGAVIVRDGEILAKDHSYVLENNDPSAHAEVTAIRNACKQVGSRKLNGATLYASHEPCLMCLACAVFAEVERIVFVTPAPEISNAYGFKNSDIFEMASRSLYPIKVERVES